MSEHEFAALSPEDADALAADLAAQTARVGVAYPEVLLRINQVAAPVITDVAEDDSDTHTETFTIDVSGILSTLRALPDGAGTAAFVAAYNATHRDWRDESPPER